MRRTEMESDSDENKFSAVDLNDALDLHEADHAESYRSDEVTLPANSYQCLRFGIAVLAASLLLSTAVWVGVAVVAHVNLFQGSEEHTAGSTMTMDELTSLARTINDTVDASVDPCVDFYEYACGSWIRANQNFSADRTSWYRSFTTMSIRNEKILQEIIAGDWPLLTPFYQSCMDTSTRDELGAQPIQEWMDAIRRISSLDDLASLLARFHLSGISGFFDAEVSPDFENPLLNILTVDQGGIGLPSRDYYLRTGEKDVALQRDYIAHLARYVYLANLSDNRVAESVAQNAYDIEFLLANFSLSPADRRDPYAVYHILPLSQLSALAPSFNWRLYLASLGINFTDASTLNVAVPDFFAHSNLWFSDENLPKLRDYLTVRVISASAKWLSSDLVGEVYQWAYIMQGASQPPQQRICQSFTNALLGELLGRYYVMEEFDPLSKEIALNMILRIEDSFVDNLPTLSWMDSSTATAAIGKMKKIVNKIGYPDSWYDFGDITVKRKEFFQNWQSFVNFMSRYMISQLGKPVDRSVWYMNPQTVNAYYNPTANEIVFPAAILQPSFFNAKWPISMNFGGIGMVMGHEVFSPPFPPFSSRPFLSASNFNHTS